VCRFPVKSSHLLAHPGDRDSHNGWTNLRGSRHATGNAGAAAIFGAFQG
jgi:hypothetical protein